MSKGETLETFLDSLAGHAAAPGGGSAAAATGAMGAALVSMVCNLTIGRDKYAAVEDQMKEIMIRSEALRAKLTELIQEDVGAFEAVMAAYRMPKDTAKEKTARTIAIQEKTKKAALTPLATARACVEVIELATSVAEIGNPNVASDGGVAVFCAQAGLKGAVLNVLINLSAIKDQTFVADLQADLDQILAGHDSLTTEIYDLAANKR